MIATPDFSPLADNADLNNEDLQRIFLEMNTQIGILLGHRVVSVDLEASRVRSEFLGKPEFCNPMGVIQGGMISAMLDTTFTMAGLAATRFKANLPTLEMKTTYVGPGFPGKFIGDGHVLRMGKSIMFLEATLFDGDENLVATASATAKLVYRPGGPNK